MAVTHSCSKIVILMTALPRAVGCIPMCHFAQARASLLCYVQKLYEKKTKIKAIKHVFFITHRTTKVECLAKGFLLSSGVSIRNTLTLCAINKLG